MIPASRSLLKYWRNPSRPLCVQCHRCLSQSPALSSGHSKWATIKHDKAKNDARRGKQMAVLAQALTDASKNGGADPVLNPRLAQAIANAKKGGFSKASIEGAVARGQGRSATGAALENMTIEAVVPPAGLIIDCQTDSKARVLQDVRVMLKKYGARESPSAYLFEKRGRTIFAAKEGVGADEVLETALEMGAIDVVEDDEGRVIVDTEVENTKTAEKSIVDDLKLEIDSSETIWHPNADTQIEELDETVYSSLVKLQEELEDYDDVKAVFTNLALPSSEATPDAVAV